jgi:hypothetical protein
MGGRSGIHPALGSQFSFLLHCRIVDSDFCDGSQNEAASVGRLPFPEPGKESIRFQAEHFSHKNDIKGAYATKKQLCHLLGSGGFFLRFVTVAKAASSGRRQPPTYPTVFPSYPRQPPGFIFLRLRTGLRPDGSADADGAVDSALRPPSLHSSIGQRAGAESKPSSDPDKAESPLSAMVRGLLGARMLLSNVVGKLLGQSLAALWAFKCSRTYRAPERRRICL